MGQAGTLSLSEDCSGHGRTRAMEDTARDGQDILPGVLAERDSGMASELGVSYVN